MYISGSILGSGLLMHFEPLILMKRLYTLTIGFRAVVSGQGYLEFVKHSFLCVCVLWFF